MLPFLYSFPLLFHTPTHVRLFMVLCEELPLFYFFVRFVVGLFLRIFPFDFYTFYNIIHSAIIIRVTL